MFEKCLYCWVQSAKNCQKKAFEGFLVQLSLLLHLQMPFDLRQELTMHFYLHEAFLPHVKRNTENRQLY